MELVILNVESQESILERIGETQAFTKPIYGVHSIVELTLHMWAWTEEVISRVKGNEPKDPVMGDWQNADDYKSEGWINIQKKFFDSTQDLIELLKSFPEEKLDQIIGGNRNPALGTGKSYESTIHGLAQHNAYHSGQIAILKKFGIG